MTACHPLSVDRRVVPTFGGRIQENQRVTDLETLELRKSGQATAACLAVTFAAGFCDSAMDLSFTGIANVVTGEARGRAAFAQLAGAFSLDQVAALRDPGAKVPEGLDSLGIDGRARLAEAFRAGPAPERLDTAPDPRLADDVLVLSCAVSERVDAAAPVYRSTLPGDIEPVLRESSLARDVPEAEVEEIAFGIARKRAMTELRVATARKLDGNEYYAAKARFEGNPQFYMKQRIDAYKAAIAKGMRRLHREEPVPTRIELDVARAVVAMHGTERQDLAEAMAEALERGTTPGADASGRSGRPSWARSARARSPGTRSRRARCRGGSTGTLPPPRFARSARAGAPTWRGFPTTRRVRACATECCTCTARSGLRNPPLGAASTPQWPGRSVRSTRDRSTSATEASAPRCDRAQARRIERGLQKRIGAATASPGDIQRSRRCQDDFRLKFAEDRGCAAACLASCRIPLACRSSQFPCLVTGVPRTGWRVPLDGTAQSMLRKQDPETPCFQGRYGCEGMAETAHQKMRRKRVEQGLCIACGKPNDSRTRRCTTCREKHNAPLKAKRADRAASGLRISCGRPSDARTTRCSSCRAEHKAQQSGREWLNVRHPVFASCAAGQTTPTRSVAVTAVTSSTRRNVR